MSLISTAAPSELPFQPDLSSTALGSGDYSNQHVCLSCAAGLTQAETAALLPSIAQDSLHCPSCVRHNERLYWARELHDRFGQQTASLSLLLKRLEAFLSSDEGRAQFGRVSQQVDAVNDEFRRVLADLHRPAERPLDLHGSLNDLIGRWRSIAGIDIQFFTSGSTDPMAEGTRLAVLRVVQEALTNIVKHAQRASRVVVTLMVADHCVNLIIEDDGPGFAMPDQTDVRSSDGDVRHGLSGMRDRVRRVGGTLQIEAVPGRGVTIHGRMPLTPLP